MSDVELKLQGRTKCVTKILEKLELKDALKVNHSCHYMDTPERCLSGQGLRLVLHREGLQWTQTLKTSSDLSKRRLEDTVPVISRGRRGTPCADLDRHQSRPAHAVLTKVLKSGPSQPWPTLVEQCLVRFSRRRRVLTSGEGDHGAITLDVGRIEINGAKRSLAEVTLRFKSGGDCQHMLVLARQLIQNHGMWLSTDSLCSCGEALAFPKSTRCFNTTSELVFAPAIHDDQQLRAMVASCIFQILPNASKVAFGQCNDEHIHQLRVGLRRLLTLRRELGTLVNAMDPSWDAPLTAAFRQLGVCRDHSLMGKLMQSQLRAAGAPESTTWPHADQVTVSPHSIVRAVSFQLALLGLLSFSLRQPTKQRWETGALRQLIEKRIRRLHRLVVADGHIFASLSLSQQHRVRKRLKRLRYLTEFGQPLFKGRSVERYLESLRPAQDALGKLNDNATVLNMLRSLPPEDAGAWFAVGWLSAHQNHAVQACRKALRRVAKAERFWV